MSEPLPSPRITTTTKPQQHRRKRILGLRLVALVVVSVVSTSKLVLQSLLSSWPDPYNDAPILLRSKAEGEEEEATTMTSPICNPSFDNVKNNNTDQRRIERIVFIHMRKAGGSTLRGYLREVSKNLGLEYIVHEGSIMPRTFFLPPSSSSSSSRYSTLDKNGTFYVTHVRDPMQRTISHYKYEGRWPCHKLVAAGNKKNTSWTPTKKNARSFETWVNKTIEVAEQKKNRPLIWSCALNCHLQWWNMLNKKETKQLANVSHVRYSEAYNHALKLAMEFDLIIDSDRLFRDEHYGKQIETFFGGVKGLVGKNKRMYCQVHSQMANALHPATISNATWLDIRTRNQPDYDLMEALRGPCADEKVAIEFPLGVSLKDYAVASSQKDDKDKEEIQRVSIPEETYDDDDDDDDDDDFDFPSKVEEVARRNREALLARRREDRIRRGSGSPLKDNVGDDDDNDNDNDDDDEDDGYVEDGEEEKDDDDDALDGEHNEDHVDDDDKDIDNDV